MFRPQSCSIPPRICLLASMGYRLFGPRLQCVAFWFWNFVGLSGNCQLVTRSPRVLASGWLSPPAVISRSPIEFLNWAAAQGILPNSGQHLFDYYFCTQFRLLPQGLVRDITSTIVPVHTRIWLFMFYSLSTVNLSQL